MRMPGSFLPRIFSLSQNFKGTTRKNTHRTMAKLWLLLTLTFMIHYCNASEPYCRQFEYDEKMLSKMIRTEIAMETLTKKLENVENNMEKEIQSGDKQFRANFEELVKTLSLNGGWTDWSGWTDCTTTCGGGIQTRYRSCDNPAPYLKGKKCEGPGSEYRSCSSQSCDDLGSVIANGKAAIQRIGFTVRSPSRVKNSTLLFKSVITNYGDSFNKRTGRFVCKVPGLYLFSATILVGSSTSSACYCHINAGSSNRALAFAHTKHDGDFPSGTATLLYQLNEGNEVYLSLCSNVEKFDPSTHFTGVFIG